MVLGYLISRKHKKEVPLALMPGGFLLVERKQKGMELPRCI
jgi:hypothetical protein